MNWLTLIAAVVCFTVATIVVMGVGKDKKKEDKKKDDS